MKSNALCFWALRALLALVATGSFLASPLSQAQQVYRIVGPDGKVTFSDRPPPPSASNAKVSEAPAANAAGEAASDSLPYELRQVARKYPVVLYTTDNCGPCGAARSMLTSRGVPFSERTITTVQDNAALLRLSGEASLPFLTIGSQQLKGFSDAEWTQYLNAAGYPKSSALPASYRLPAPAPLVTLDATSAARPASEGAQAGTVRKTPEARPVQPPVTGSNPAGIKF
jgi:glutaredoxin